MVTELADRGRGQAAGWKCAGGIQFVLPWGGDGSDQQCHREGLCDAAHNGGEKVPCVLSVQLHLSRAVLTEANRPPFPQHDLVLSLRAHPQGVGSSPADSASAIVFLFKTRFLQKRLIKPAWLTSGLEERSSDPLQGQGDAPRWLSGGAGQVQGCGVHSPGRGSAGRSHCTSHPSEHACLAGLLLSILATKAARGWRTPSSLQRGELQAGDGAKAGTGWAEERGC